MRITEFQVDLMPLLKSLGHDLFHLGKVESFIADEGASGAHLELCVQAHLKAEEALLSAFRRTKGSIEAAFDSRTGFLRLKWVPGPWKSKIGA